MNPSYQRGHPWTLSRGSGRALESSSDSWHSTQPPLSWGGGTGREDLSLDSWHSANRTWRGDLSSFGTYSSERSERSLFSLFSDSEGSVEPSEDGLQELLGEAGDNQSSLGALDLGGVPRDLAVVQPGQEGLESSTRRGGRSIRGTRENREGCVPELSWRKIGDRTRIQSPHRSDSRPLDTLTRRHWVQLGLSHRRPAPPVLRYPVLQLPLHAPLIPHQPHTEGIVRNALHRQRRVGWWMY